MHTERHKERNDHEDAYEIIEVADQYDLDEWKAKCESLEEAYEVEKGEVARLEAVIADMKADLVHRIKLLHSKSVNMEPKFCVISLKAYTEAWAQVEGVEL